MSDKHVIHSEDFANTEYDGSRRARGEQTVGTTPTEQKPKLEPATDANRAPDVRPTQKDTDEASVVQREAQN